ncbi:hypothetical protein OIU79_017879 [Salix purpurea]|uniref:Pentatricopeptide repeat-containing protein n=1 Tax=Salix purpurea TaxID=77065 RepID=A0A9Q0WW19_SALPP|nr:hypothetical protein OIU79_017879 [Salix purpurea]
MVALSRKFSTATSDSLTYISLKQFSQNPQKSTPFYQIQQQQLEHLKSQIVTTLDGCKNLTQIKQVHARILLSDLEQSCFVLAKLIRTLIKLNFPVDPYPRSIFNRVKYPNPFLYNALIRGYLIEERLNESIELYSLMRKEGVGPLSFTFAALFKACGANMNMSLGRQIHGQTILVGGFDEDLHVGNSMIDMYIKCGFLEFGRKVFDEMPKRDVISWTELISAYAKNGNMESAGELFDGLPVKDMVAWTVMVSGFAQNAKPREAIMVFEKMQESGVETDEITLLGVISACAQLGAAKYADWIRDVAEKSEFGGKHSVVIFELMEKCYGIKPSADHYTCMVDLLGRAGRLQEAHELVKTMPIEPHGGVWGALLGACRIHKSPDIAAIAANHLFELEPYCIGNYVLLANVYASCGRFECSLGLCIGSRKPRTPLSSHGGLVVV